LRETTVDPEQQVQVRIGLFTLVVLIALAAVVLFLTREGGLFTTTYALHADFDNIQGLTQNAPVHLAGNHVGRVRSIYFLGPEAERAIRVELEIDSRVRDRIRSDSRAMIQTIGLLGDKYVALTLGSPEVEPLTPGVPMTSVEPINFEEVAEEGRQLLGHMTGLTRSAETVLGRFEEEMGGESLAVTLGGLQRFVEEIERGDGLLHSVVYDDAGVKALEELDASLAHIRSILREIEEGEGTLHNLVYAPPGDLSALDALADSTVRLDQILRKIDEGEGTLGALVNDPAVYEDLRLLVSGARRSALLRTLIDYVRPEDGN
jgi:phospholipid/cholesterol/gamma-HCH transport system substrate-binding protein